MTDYYVDEEYEDAFEEDYDYYAGEDLEEGIDDLRPAEVEGRTSWIYLAVLGALFVVLVFFSWACNDRSVTPGEPATEESSEVTSGTSVRLAVVVDGDVVTVSGVVPDEAARQQILIAIQDQYGPENVIDELQTDEATTLEAGSVSITGAAPFDDGRPATILESITAGLGLTEDEFVIDRGQVSVDAVALDAQLANDAIRLLGVVPDQESIAELTAAAEAVWGPGSVDTTGLTIADSTWSDGRIRVTGSAGPGDSRIESFPAEVQSRLGALVVVDIEEVVVDLSPETLTQLEADIATQVLAEPILFAPLSAEIAPESEGILATVADQLNSISEVTVEVVGHTDNAGDEDENQALSLQRAEAVIARLVELGVDGSRLNARGEGESIPLVPNDTPEGREQNRRIEFRLVGAG